MKIIILLLLTILTITLGAQNYELKLSIKQYDKKVKLKNNEATIDKSAFTLIVKFQQVREYTSLGVLVGKTEPFKNKSLEPIKDGHSDLFIDTEAGATSYFNPDKRLHAGGSYRINYFSYSSDTTHDYNKVQHKGNWIIGDRIVESFSTKEGPIPIEAWEDSVMYIVVSHVKYDQGKLIELNRAICHLSLNEIEVPLTDVRGKLFVGEPGKWQEGCEGCGNGGDFRFSMNGKDVDYLLPGSDTGSFSEYKQEGNQIIIEGEMTLTISEDGKTITDNKYGTVFTLSNR